MRTNHHRAPRRAKHEISIFRRLRQALRAPRSGRRLLANSVLAVTAMAGIGFGLSPAAYGAVKTQPFRTIVPAIGIAAKSSIVSKGDYLDLTATAKDPAGVPVGGQRVNLQREDHGRWVTIGSTRLSATGSGGFHFKVWNPHTFRAVIATPARAGTAMNAAVSRPLPIKTVFDEVAFGKAVVADAARHKGARYVWNTDGPRTFDCSGLVKHVFSKYGIFLPHHADDMKHYGIEIAREKARPGDLVFAFYGRFAHHVAIYAGKGAWWEAPHAGAFVQHVKLRGKHLEFRRVDPSDHDITW